jgi:hypothetical protein
MSKLKILYFNEIRKRRNHCTRCSERWRIKCKSMTRVSTCCVVKMFNTIT